MTYQIFTDADMTEEMVRTLSALGAAACAGGPVEAVMRARALTELAERLDTDQLVRLAYRAGTDPNLSQGPANSG